MTEPQNSSSSVVGSKSKAKGSLLDEEIGKDFLNSWKSMSVTQDDAMDFSFGTITKAKNMAFNFDKLDMDFNMDGDFDKLSSFKVDMPDLDFSSNSNRTAKDKEISKEKTSSGKRQEKKDRFTFSFNFNELDGFDFDSSLTKVEKNCKKSQDSKAVALESNEISNIDLALDDRTAAKLSVSKNEANSKAETPKGGTEACNSILDPCPSEVVPLEGLAHGNSVAAQGSKVSPEKSMDTDVKEKEKIVDTDVKEKSKSSPSTNRTVSPELFDQQFIQSSPMDSFGLNNSNQETVSILQAEVCSRGTRSNTSSGAERNDNDKKITTEGSIHKKYTSSSLSSREVSSELYDQQALLSSPMGSLSGNNSNQETVSHEQAEVCSQGTRIITSSNAEKNVNDKIIASEGSIHKKLHCKDSFPPSESDEDGRNGAGCNIPTEIQDSQSVQGDTILKDISTASSLGDMSDDTGAKNKKDNQNSTPKLSLVSSDRCSEPTLTQLTARKDREAGIIRSRFFTRSEKTIFHLPKPSETEKEVSSFSSKKIGDMYLCTTTDKREDSDGAKAEIGRKLVGYSNLSSQELTKGKLVLKQRENNVGSCTEMRDGFIADAVQIGGSKSTGKSNVKDKEATKEEPILLRSEKNASLRANFPNSAEKTTESGSQTSVNPKLEVPEIASIQNSRFLSIAPKNAMELEAPALSNFKSARTTGPSKDELNSKKETILSGNLEQNKISPRNTFNVVPPVGNGETKTPKLPSLKRKAVENSSGHLMLLKPLKRLSQSERRNIEETSERVADEEVQNQRNIMEVSPKDVQSDHIIPESEVSKEVNMTELEFPSVVENDEIVEKAEAYGKELDDICNMLKKKHEEAKELLVRAVVNNNYLLMLNHAMVKEKINMVEKFAQLLISKEMPK